jgi:hypothetical protein
MIVEMFLSAVKIEFQYQLIPKIVPGKEFRESNSSRQKSPEEREMCEKQLH